MAQTKKTTAGKTATKKKAAKKSAEIIPDFFFETEHNGAKVELSLYDKEDKNDRIKLTIAESFVIYCTAVVMDDYAFISYPSFKTKSGDFVNQAFCFVKELIEELNDALTGYYFE